MRCIQQRRVALYRLLSVLMCAVSVLLGMPVLAGNRLNGERPVTFTDLAEFTHSDPFIALAPDGRSLAYSLGRESVWMVATHLGAVPKRIATGYLPSWSPTGKQLAYYVQGQEGLQLWIFDLQSEEHIQLTRLEHGIDPDPTTRGPGFVDDAFLYSWSPDGSEIAFVSRIPTAHAPSSIASPDAPLVFTDSTAPDMTLSGVFTHFFNVANSTAPATGGDSDHDRSNHLFIVNVETKTMRQVMRDPASYFNPAWSPDGQFIVCASSGVSGTTLGKDSINLYQIDVSTGTIRPITQGIGSRSRPAFSPSGGAIAFLSRGGYFGRADVMVSSIDGRRLINITAALDRQIDDFAWSDGGRTIAITYNNGLSHSISRVSVASGTIEAIDKHLPELISVSRVAASHKDKLAWSQSDLDTSSSIQFQSGRSAPITLVDLYPQTKVWMRPRVETIHWRNGKGEDVEGALLYPDGFQQDKRYPLIVDAYPTINGVHWEHPMMGNRAWAAMGYVVFRPSPPAPNDWLNFWKSTEFSLSGRGPQGWDVTLDHVLTGVDEVIRRGIADPDRLCLYGFSNGGGVVNYLITRTDRFKCAVSVAGALSNWVRPALLHTDLASQLAAWAGGPSLWDDPERYIQLSAVYHVATVKTPVLLAAGDNDGNFLLDSIEMYNGLRSVGVDVTFVRYPGQGHGFTGAALADFWSREISFFEKFLRPSPAVH
jgi:acylaminoacyl-peptidase